MVATELNRLPSFKSRRTLSPLENEPRERKSNPEKNLSSDREPSANSGLDIETENFSATGGGRSFFVDIPFYRTTYLKGHLFESGSVRGDVEQRWLNHCRQLHIQRRLNALSGA